MYMIFLQTKSGIFLDSMENFHLFWKSSQTISASGQVSNKTLDKIYLFWNISRWYEKVSFILEKFLDNICFRSSFQQYSGQNLFNLEHFQILWKSFIYPGKVSAQNLFLDIFPDQFLDQIFFQTKPGIFPDSMEFFYLLSKSISKKYFPNNFSDQNFRKKYVSGQNLDYFQIV